LLVLYTAASLALVDSPLFYTEQLIFLAGIVVVALAFTVPNVPDNFKHYFAYWSLPKTSGHFRLYAEYFRKIGKPIRKDMRGAGIQWVCKFFWRIAPFHSLYYVLSLLFIGWLAVFRFDYWSLGVKTGVVLASVSPILIGELTQGPQIARSYYPAFIGMLLLIGDGVYNASQSVADENIGLFRFLVSVAILVSLAWNIKMFVTDILPARMAPVYLMRTLQRLGIRSFYTYKTSYNDAFVNILPREFLHKVQVNFIERINDVRDGYVVVPGTSSKALNMESQTCALEGADFHDDALLDELIKSKAIPRFAIASFKTFGTSRMWCHESEVTSYRDLILREINEDDRWRGRAWILDAGKVYKAFVNGNVSTTDAVTT
jgi:hypothetical protein